MNYISTRGGLPPQPFCAIALMGLAPDGGLVVPEHYPKVSRAQLDTWRTLSYTELAFEILRLYIDDIPEAVLRTLIDSAYTVEKFGSDSTVALKSLSDGITLLQLSNGPTLAFKDIALQFLGNLFEYILDRQEETMTVLGATSGDTGSAAEYALRGKTRIRVFMLSPDGRMSPFQRAQMYSVQDKNIHNIAIQGTFDDCQDLVKTVAADASFKKRYRLGAVNSINWVRIVAQTVYYFYGYLRATDDSHQSISFCIPSGNFGNVYAGHVARQMGLPIARLMVATNENDVLAQFFTTGLYRPRPRHETYTTSSPSMDISKASNLERFIFDVVGQKPEYIRTLWSQVEQGVGFDWSAEPNFDKLATHYGFIAGRSSHAERIATIRSVYESSQYMLDPHTADGVKVAGELRQSGEQVLCLETALAVKFSDAIVEALGRPPICPERFVGLEDRPQYVQILPNDVHALKALIRMSSLNEQRVNERSDPSRG